MSGEWRLSKIERGMTAKDFLRWEAYDRLFPFGEKGHDWRAAAIRQMVFNMAVNVKDRQTVDKFLLTFEDGDAKKKAGQSWEEKKAIGVAIAMAYSSSGKQAGKKPLDSEAKAAAMAEAVVKAYGPKAKG